MGLDTGTTQILYNPEATTWADRSWAIYLRTLQKTELDVFLDTTTMKVRNPALQTQVIATKNIRSMTRRRYPGGPAISIPARTATYVKGVSAKLQAYPGRPITLERPKDGSAYDPANADVPMKVLQITLEGKFPGFYQYCEQFADITFLLRTNAGRPILITAT